MNKQIDQIDDDLEDDRIELLNPAIVKKIGLVRKPVNLILIKNYRKNFCQSRKTST